MPPDSHHSVLVLDDDPRVLKTLELLLTRRGYRVCAFSDPQLAFETLRAEPFDLLLLDMHLPQRTGLDMLQEARDLCLESAENVPVIILSGDLSPSVVRRAEQLGAAACIQKPFNVAEFYETVEGLCPP